ncbi:KICSTOR complex protein SZT2 isoform X3 [Hydra vulgaris]|uniref:KICSTOR complex protein SZT2 isoform X3 n=1 Tax=Hydra vulgaris TaxID=6087 RepID=A0ABM4CKH1_HYDVU
MEECGSESMSADIDAEDVWLLMGRDYRISRSIRLQWFFEHLNKSVSPKTDEELVNSNEELEVVSVLPVLPHKKTVIVPTTKLSFVGRQYRFVFCIDMSPSLASLDTETGNVLIDDVFENMKNTLVGLVQPFCIPGSSLESNPNLHLTVLAHTFINVRECQVLVQGYCVNVENVKFLLCQLKRKLQVLENSINEELRKQNQGVGEKHANGIEQSKSNETGLFYIIRDGLLALQLLPDNASAAIVVITDGVFNMENSHVAEALLSQVRNSAAVCSFIQVGSGYKSAAVGYGYVPHCTLMQFIATATSGAYLIKCPPVRKTNNSEMNIYHKALFCWNFQRDIDRYKIDSWNQEFIFLTKESKAMLSPQTQQTIRYKEFELQTKISSVLTVRSREGYITDGIRFTKDNKFIEVKLVWPWKEFVTIEYIAKAAWPFESMSHKTEVIVSVCGPYEFLVDITSTKQRNHPLFRKFVLQSFDQSMKSLETSDQLLVQLQMFPIHTAATLIPDAVAQGSPLYFMPPNSDTSVLALQYGNSRKSKSSEIQFANFWKPIVSMDTRTWSKWLHCHRISILLEHDRPVAKEVFTPASNKNYTCVHRRAAVAAFNGLLKRWCSFTLLENHSYIKFMTSNSGDKPSSFCVLRLKHKGLCIVIRLAFLAGTPGKDRIKEVEYLKEQLGNLRAPFSKMTDLNSSVLSKSQIELPCIIFLTKQFERILVKYDLIPDEVRKSVQLLTNENVLKRFSKDYSSDFQEQNRVLQDQQRIPGSILSEYLFNQRWVWTMHANEHIVLEDRSVSQMLEAILKRRLYEGFHFSSSVNKGIISMVKEINVNVDSTRDHSLNCCVIQYVIFPPHSQVLKGCDEKNVQDDSNECLATIDVEGHTQLVTEIWVEPQLGTMDTSITPLEYIHGMEYNNIPAKIFSIDAQIVTDMSTYMALHMSCRSHVKSLPIDSYDLPIIPTDTFQSSSLIKIPFLFDLLPVLKKSRLILSLYPLMKDDTVKDPNDILLLHLSDTLRNMTDYIVPLKPNFLKAIVSYICQRSNNNNLTIWLGDSKAPFMCYSNLNVEFICYVKSFGSRIIIIFVPKSIKDLDMVVKYEEKNIKNSHGNRKNLPIFIFECEYEAIISVPSKYISFEQDVIQDYSAALSESALTPRHLNQKLPENRSKEIACICQAVYDHYFWALVTSVYHCLQNGYTLDSDDVELSIELVCEEFTKEIDISDFIKTVCVHMQTVNTSFNTIEDIVFPEVSDQFSISNKKLLNVKKCSSSGSSSYLSSHGSLKSKVNDCENHFLKNEIKNLFLKILARHFTSVPNNPYFMYFTSSHPEETSSVKLLNSQSSYSSHDEDPYSTSGPESDDQTESDGSEIFFKKSETPLFLHLTSSCHYKSSDDGYTMRPVSVTSLPTCIEDIFNKFDDHGRDIDIFSKQFKITLDLVCLTQPSEPEEGDEWETPYDVLNRRNSSDSFYSLESQEYHSRARKRLLTEISKDESYMKHNDGLDGLTRDQKNAVSNVIEEINWLLKDEIASALRTHGPVVETSLDIVAEHVRNSPNVENCKFEKRYFKFVTGIETVSDLSSSLFIYELESVNLDGYILKRVGKYYCVVVENIECENKKVEDDIKQYNFQHRNKGHRRSQSDVTNSFQSSIKRKQTSTNEFIMSRSFSDSTIFLDTLHPVDLYKHVDPSSDKYLKQVNNDSVSKIQSMQSLISSDDLSARLFNEKKNLLEPNQTSQIDDESCEEFCETKLDDLEEDLQPSPDFWLFIHNCEESVNIYLHRRRCEHTRNIFHQTTIYNRLLETLDHICKVVNQRILLENLYSTNQCHNLLIAEDDYDRVWDETTENSDIAYIKNLDSNNQPFSSHADIFFKPGNLVQADFHFKPGSFECELVLQRNIPIHKRLRAPTQVGGKSRGLLAIHRELSKFRISNRKNIFVIKDKSNNVFYFKVNEIKSNRSQSIIILDEEFNTFKPVSRQLSPTSSYASLLKFEDQNDAFEESDQSTLISSRTDEKFAENEQQDYIQFLVYGISEPDQTIKHEMIQMISNKLDNANLELISVSLIRNPKSKLTPEDVEFIQARKPLAYKLVLCVSNMAARFMHAIMFYLHQHLLLQYNTPKYSTTNPEYHFKNYTECCSSTTTEATIPSCDLFLYNRDVMKEESNIGIGVIYMSLVNLEGIKVVAQPCYPLIKYEFIKLSQQKDILSEMLLLKQLDSLTEADTNICKNVMIQFSIWERGNINKEMLIKSLITNTRYALSDVYIEYDLLCTPICFVPLTLQQSFQCSRRHSLVHPETCCSPHIRQGTSSTSTTPQFGKKQMVLRKFLSEPTTPCENQPNKDEIKDAPESYGSFEINVNDAEKRIPPVKKYSNDCSSSMSSSRPSLSRHSTLSDKDFQETLTGAVANDLNQAYYVLTDAECSESLKATDTSNKTWAEIEIQRRTELSIRKERRKFENGLSGDLHYHYSGCAHSLFDELINMENASLLKHVGLLTHHYSMEIVLNEVVKEFLKCSPDIKPKVFKGIKMTDGDFIFTQLKDHNESRADSIKTSLSNESLIPGNWCRYIVIGRNAQKWLQSMGTDESEVSDDEEGKQSNQEDQSKQKFKPLCYNNNNNLNQDRNYLNEPQSPSCISPGFVPRQKFFMAYFEEKKISVYTYNFSNEVNAVLEKQLKRLYAWNNVRSHINNCLFMQKLGLFHHKHFVRDCPGKSDPDVLAFSRSTDKSCIIPLMRDVIPPKEIVKVNDLPDPKRLEFDNVFRDTAPTHSLHHSDYYFRRDLIKRQAFQYLDVKNKKANLAYQQTVLKEIYNSWKQEGAYVPIAEERLQSLKKHCRLLHYCNASLLFDIGENKESEEKTAKEENSEYEDLTNDQKGWYEELKWTLVQQYIQYLQTLGLCLIQVLNKNSQKAKSTSNTRNQKTRSDTLVDERPTRYNLQKTSAGGIIVMEVFLERNHLCYSLLAFSSMYLNDIKQFVSPKDVTNFYRNCYEFKDLTHLQSFSYDFHIRMCQHQFSGRPSVFPKYYCVHKLMENILQHYPKPPRFSRLIITNGLLNIPCTIGLNANTVYRYFITKASNFGLAKLEMSPTRDVFDPKDYLLFYRYTTEKQPVQFVEGWRTRRDTTDFDGFVAVHFCVDINNGMLNIPFYLILVNKKEFYPRPHLLTSVSSALRGRHKANSGMDSVVFYENVENVKQRSRVRFCTEAPDNTAQQISNEMLKYTPSWIHNSLDSDKEQLMEINLSDINSSVKSSVQTSARSSLSNISYDSRCSDSTDSDISIPESFCKTTSSTLETFLRNESKFVQLEQSRVLEKLHEKFDDAFSNCWRDLCWHEILAYEKTLDEETMQRKNKKKSNTDESSIHSNFLAVSQWRLKNLFQDVCDTYFDIGYDDVTKMFELVSFYKIRSIDKRLYDALNFISLNKPGVLSHLLRLVTTKYESYCRKFVSRDENVYVCILNPDNLDMFVLIDVKNGNMEISVVYRLKPQSSPLDNAIEENLTEVEKISRSHIENVITCLISNLFETIVCS